MIGRLADIKQKDAAARPGVQASVIVPAFNSQATIDRCLAALAQQTQDRNRYEVIVVDDGSTDGTRSRVKAYDGVRLLSQPHQGPASARNLGVEHARGEIVLFTDADCEPTPSWIEEMLAPFAEGQVVGVKGAYLTRQRSLVARFVQIEYETRYERTAREMARSGRIDFVDTYAAAYRRDIFVASGGFDPSFGTASVEDQEFSFRLAGQGHRMVFAPRALVYHWGHAATPWAYVQKKFKIGYHKVAVLARHTRKVKTDSHTPQGLKAQIALIGLGGCAFIASLVYPPLIWAALGLLGFFMLATIPFALQAWKQDILVSIVSPPLLLLRALALGSGLLAGTLGYLGKRALARGSR